MLLICNAWGVFCHVATTGEHERSHKWNIPTLENVHFFLAELLPPRRSLLRVLYPA